MEPTEQVKRQAGQGATNTSRKQSVGWDAQAEAARDRDFEVALHAKSHEIVKLLHGLPFSQAVRALAMAQALAGRCGPVDIHSPAFAAAQTDLQEFREWTADTVRWAAYIAQAKRLGQHSRLAALTSANASGPSLEKLVAEFGGEFLQQGGDVESLDHPDDGTTSAALNE